MNAALATSGVIAVVIGAATFFLLEALPGRYSEDSKGGAPSILALGLVVLGFCMIVLPWLAGMRS